MENFKLKKEKRKSLSKECLRNVNDWTKEAAIKVDRTRYFKNLKFRISSHHLSPKAGVYNPTSHIFMTSIGITDEFKIIDALSKAKVKKLR